MSQKCIPQFIWQIHRVFGSVREQFLARSLDWSSLDALNRQFTHWVEEVYNASTHSVLNMTQLDRFALDRARVRYLPPNQANDELFFVEEDRTVRADNTFSFKTKRFAAPRHLPDRVVQIRFERRRPSDRVIVYYKAERMRLQEREAGNYAVADYPGLIFKDSYWRWPERDLAGNAIDFCVKVLGLSFNDAMREISRH